MPKSSGWKVLGLAVGLLASACSSQQNPGGPFMPGGDGGKAILVPPNGAGGYVAAVGGSGAGGSGTGGVPGTGGVGMGGAGGQPVVCCPPDAQPSGCTHLGGAATDGMCWETCDFWGSSNWRIETDAQGCPFWNYDLGTCPDADATFMCPDAGAPRGADAGGIRY